MSKNVKVSDLGAEGRKDDSLLTTRELEIVVLVVDGLSNREIGERLAISARTVQSHLAATMRKLRANTRTQVAVAALRAGLVAIDGPPPAGAVGGGLGEDIREQPPAARGLAGAALEVDVDGGSAPGGRVPVSRWEYQLKVRARPGGRPGGTAED